MSIDCPLLKPICRRSLVTGNKPYEKPKCPLTGLVPKCPLTPPPCPLSPPKCPLTPDPCPLTCPPPPCSLTCPPPCPLVCPPPTCPPPRCPLTCPPPRCPFTCPPPPCPLACPPLCPPSKCPLVYPPPPCPLVCPPKCPLTPPICPLAPPKCPLTPPTCPLAPPKCPLTPEPCPLSQPPKPQCPLLPPKCPLKPTPCPLAPQPGCDVCPLDNAITPTPGNNPCAHSQFLNKSVTRKPLAFPLPPPICHELARKCPFEPKPMVCHEMCPCSEIPEIDAGPPCPFLPSEPVCPPICPLERQSDCPLIQKPRCMWKPIPPTQCPLTPSPQECPPKPNKCCLQNTDVCPSFLPMPGKPKKASPKPATLNIMVCPFCDKKIESNCQATLKRPSEPNTFHFPSCPMFKASMQLKSLPTNKPVCPFYPCPCPLSGCGDCPIKVPALQTNADNRSARTCSSQSFSQSCGNSNSPSSGSSSLNCPPPCPPVSCPLACPPPRCPFACPPPCPPPQCPLACPPPCPPPQCPLTCPPPCPPPQCPLACPPPPCPLTCPPPCPLACPPPCPPPCPLACPPPCPPPPCPLACPPPPCPLVCPPPPCPLSCPPPPCPLACPPPPKCPLADILNPPKPLPPCPVKGCLKKTSSKNSGNCPMKTDSCALFPEGRCPMEDLGLCDCDYPVPPCLADSVNKKKPAPAQYCVKDNCCMGLPDPPIIPAPLTCDTFYSLMAINPDNECTKYYIDISNEPPEDMDTSSISAKKKPLRPQCSVLKFGDGFKQCKTIKSVLDKRAPCSDISSQYDIKDCPMDNMAKMIQRSKRKSKCKRKEIT